MFGNRKYNSFLQHPGFNDPVISPTLIAAISAGTSVASAVGQYRSGQEAAAAQEKAQEAQSRATQVSAQRERLQALREARIKRAQIQSLAGVQGVGGSGVQGAVSSIGSQLGANIGYMNVQEGFAQQASQANIQASQAMAEGATWQAIGGLAKQVNTIFSGPTPKTYPPTTPFGTSYGE